MCECSVEGIQLDHAEMPNQLQNQGVPWEIECECVHSNCGLPHAIYTRYLGHRTKQDVLEDVLKANPRISCTGDHNAEFDSRKMKVRKLEF